jgi:hypothetical protein
VWTPRALPLQFHAPKARSVGDRPLCSRHEITVLPANAPGGTVFRAYAAGTVAASKNNAWAIAAFTVER